MGDAEGKRLPSDLQDATSRPRRVMFSDEVGITKVGDDKSTNLSPREQAATTEGHSPPDTGNDAGGSHPHPHHRSNRSRRNNRHSGPPPTATPVAAPAPVGEDAAHSPIPVSSSPDALEGLEGLEGKPEGRRGRWQRSRRRAEEAREAVALLETQERKERAQVEGQLQGEQSHILGEVREAWMKEKARLESLQTCHPNGENNDGKKNGGDHSGAPVKIDPDVQHLQHKLEFVQCGVAVDDAGTAATRPVQPPSKAETKEEKEGQPKLPSSNNIIQWTLGLLSRLSRDRTIWPLVLLVALLFSRRLLLCLRR